MHELSLPLDAFRDALHRHVGPDALKPMKMMAAQGLVPGPPVEQLTILHQLSLDDDPDVRDTAVGSLLDMPASIMSSAAQQTIHGPVLHTIALFRDEPIVLERVILHQQIEDYTLIDLARKASTEIADLIAGNEVRILREPAIIEALYLNEHTRMSTINRVLEFARRNKLDFKGLPILRALLNETPDEEATLEETVDDDTFTEQLKTSLAEDQELSDEEAERAARAEEPEEDKRGMGNRQAEIDRMSLSEKIRTATLGSRSDREVLVRNANRLVHTAAVSSPKVGIKDITNWAQNKSLPENVINYISNHREYRRNYTIQVALINNPKLPLAAGIRMLNYLHPADLKKLNKNRNVAPQIRRSAKSLLEAREKRKS